MNLSAFENKRILIVGDIMLDEFLYTTSVKNSPEYKDVPVLNINNKKEYLGGAANVALNIKKLKAIPYLVGTTGNDEAGKVIMQLLNDEDISTQYIFIDHSVKTTRKTRLFMNDQPILRMDEEHMQEYEKVTYDFLLKNINDAITHHKPHVIILQDYNKGVLNISLIEEILSLAKQHRILVCVDPKFDNWEAYKDVDLFKPNKKEFAFMTEGENDTLEVSAKKLQDKIHFKNLLVTLGSEGNFIFDGKYSTFNIHEAAVENPDVCGAGDTVIAVAALGLACGFPLMQIAELSNKAGYIVCTKENVQPVTLEELVLSS
ncbi:MAG: carbohydrate kinase [Bacteroidota bacterium]|nr:carbohydrate kinase [Bacteroidota bacterium]